MRRLRDAAGGYDPAPRRLELAVPQPVYVNAEPSSTSGEYEPYFPNGVACPPWCERAIRRVA